MQQIRHRRIRFAVMALTLILILIPLTQVSAQPDTIIINEVDSDTPSYDELEFIELYDGGAGNTALDGAVVVLKLRRSRVLWASTSVLWRWPL